MKKNYFLLPAVLFVVLTVVTWACKEEEEPEDVCQSFPACEIYANACCPDEGDCYYEYNDQTYYCDADSATESDPDGCNFITDSLVAIMCGEDTTGAAKALIELRQLTRQLMKEAREQSLCVK